MDCIKLSHFDTAIELTKGQECSYLCRQHNSVGLTSDYTIGDSEVLKLVTANVVLENVQQEKNPLPGGDKATKTYTFVANEIGTCQLTMISYERGSVARTQDIQVTVV